MKRLFLLGLCAAMLFAAGCGSNTLNSAGCAASMGGKQNDTSAVQKAATPDYPQPGDKREPSYGSKLQSALAGFSSRTASALLGNGQENAAYSPISLYMALALSASGAAGETLDEIYSLLGLAGIGKSEVAKGVNALFTDLYSEEEYGHLLLYNSLWLSSDFSFKQSFLTGAADDYFAEIYTVDPSKELNTDPISDWVGEKTGGKLERAPSEFGESVMSLVSVVNFYGEWTNQFSKDRNTVADFYLADGTKVDAEYMNSGAMGDFYRSDGWTLASLQCKNSASMVFILPDEGVDINALFADEGKVSKMFAPSDYFESLYGEIEWAIPKFDIVSNLSLKETLIDLGMQSAFKQDADFSETSASKPLFLSDAKQASRVTVDENGVSATSYTELNYAGSAMPQDKAAMVLNRPFAFVINYRGVTLFAGIVNDPS